ncbi:MAG: FAD-binding oxidoreductase [Flavobacteriaceae bacterium]|nr:FAD-binding oxidoreductase [Bacteroidia bacterium]NNK86743.1 FAD-binding oxidoreductase [Flavobacteriaceae bacterium]
MKVDYIIVGCGLAGLAFSHRLKEAGKSFVIYDNSSQKSSMVAGGLYNPVMLKRMTLAWRADVQLNMARPFYSRLEIELQKNFDHPIPIRRLIHSPEEQNNWFQACDNPVLKSLLYKDLIKANHKGFDSPFGLGEVNSTGWIDTRKLIEAYKKVLKNKNLLRHEPFQHKEMITTTENIQYNDIISEQVVFAEGFGMKKNPFFNELPLTGNKGELLTIKAPGLKIDFILKSGIFLIPLGDNLYKAGATYNREDKSDLPSERAKKELQKKLSKLLNCDYTIVDHIAGIRPTVKDRRPLVGRHKKHKNLYILNGFGSRGVLIAPYASEILYNHIESGEAIPGDMDISRFDQDLGRASFSS